MKTTISSPSTADWGERPDSLLMQVEKPNRQKFRSFQQFSWLYSQISIQQKIIREKKSTPKKEAKKSKNNNSEWIEKTAYQFGILQKKINFQKAVNLQKDWILLAH